MNILKKKICSFINNIRGSILVMSAFVIGGLVSVTAGAIDAATYVNINNRFQSALDNALVSAVPVAQTQDIDKVTREFFFANFPEKYHDSIDLTSIDVIEDPENMGWTVHVDAKVKTNFAQHIGIDDFDISHTVKVQWDISRRVETIFTLDISASMCMDIKRDEQEDGTFRVRYLPDYNCKKLNAMKRAMHHVIDNGFAVIKDIENPVFYAGVVPFNHKVKLPSNRVPAPLQHAELHSGDKDYYRNFEDAEPLSPIIPLTAMRHQSDKTTLKRSISRIKQSPTGLGWTRSNVATLTAAMMLDNRYHSYFGGVRPTNFHANDVDKIVVMMTDGANIGCCYAAHEEGNFDNQYLYLYQMDNLHLTGKIQQSIYKKWHEKYHMGARQGLCDQMKKAGIIVYSVVYDVNDNDPGGKAIKNAYKGCAHSKQHFFDVKSEKDLKNAYQTIAQSLLRIRITY